MEAINSNGERNARAVRVKFKRENTHIDNFVYDGKIAPKRNVPNR